MVSSHFLSCNGQRFAVMEFSLSDLALPGEGMSETVMCPRLMPFSFAARSFQYIQSLSIVGHGLIKFVLCSHRIGQTTIVTARVGMLLAMNLAADAQPLANNSFGHPPQNSWRRASLHGQ